MSPCLTANEGPHTNRADEQVILLIRGQKVILDDDLARLYGVTTKRLNEQVKRNRKRFPDDFIFQLKLQEVRALRSQIATLKLQSINSDEDSPNRSHFATSSSRHLGTIYRPWAFTEHGAIMAHCGLTDIYVYGTLIYPYGGTDENACGYR